ncbi:MAG: hypothetical protein QXT12_04375 [Nitrososphaerota archaeon]
MSLNSFDRIIIFVILSFIILLSLNLNDVYGQPAPWPLKIIIEPKEYYLGEEGVVVLNITNNACSGRVDKKDIMSWTNQEKSVTDPFVKRAEEMISEGRLLAYTLISEEQYVVGDKEYGNYKLSLYGVCVGEPIEIRSVAIWFSWKGFGRALISSIEREAKLKAFDAAYYIINGQDAGSSIVVEIVFQFPSTLPPELVPTDPVVPNIEVTMRLPSGTIWTFDRGFKVNGGLTIIPSRTFKLKIMDNSGEMPVPSGILRIQALIHTYYLREYTFSEGSEILIERLPDEYDYLVTVLHESPYTGTEEVFRAIMNSYELASSGALKTNLYNLKIVPLDLLGRQLNGAQVFLNNITKTSKDGVAVFNLVPAGNFTLNVKWMNEDVLKQWIWIGYHSTLNPSGAVPEYITLTTNVGDLIVQVSDAEGNPIGAYFSVSGPGVEINEKHERDGLLILHQLPLSEYQILVKNYSEVVDRIVSASVLHRPGKGEVSILKLPIYKVTLNVLTIDGKPLPGAAVRIGKIITQTGGNGEASLGTLPSDIYKVSITLNGITIFDEPINIEKSGKIELVAKACSIRILLKDSNGEPQAVYWHLTGPEGKYRGYGEIIDSPPIPDEPHKLTIMLWQYAPAIVEEHFRPSEMISGEILLPVSRMRIETKWGDGKPVTSGKIVIASEKYNLSRTLSIHSQVIETSEKLPFTEYVIKVYLPSGQEVLSEKREFRGGPIELIIPTRSISISVRDVFGQVIQNATVEAYYSNYFIGREITNQDGVAIISRIPAYLAGQILISVSYRDVKTEKYLPITQAETAISLDAVKIGIAVIPLGEFIKYITIGIVLIIAFPVILLINKLLRRKETK